MGEVERVVTKLCRELDKLQEEAKSYVNTMHQLEDYLQEKVREFEIKGKEQLSERKN